jgi:hypothetical protein
MNGEDLIRLAIRVNRNLPDLYHISFNHDLEGMWTPVEPDGDYTEENVDLVTETVIAKISVSPTIEQCFQAIYANVKHLFGGRGRSKMTFAVYKPRFTGRERIILPKAFTEQRAIHDAHITEEHGIIDPTYMEYLGRVEIEVPKSSDKLYYYAFDDRSGKEPYGWLPWPVNVIKDLPSMESWYEW